MKKEVIGVCLLVFWVVVLQGYILFTHFKVSGGARQAYEFVITPVQGHDIGVTVAARDIKPELLGKSVKVSLIIEEDK